MVGPRRPQFVLFGSSIVQFSYGGTANHGWGAILSDIYARQADIVVRGYAGWNSRRGLQVLDRVFPRDAAVQPSLVIVYFGGNDSMTYHPSGLTSHVPLPEYIDNMRKIALHLKSLSESTRLIFLSTPPVNEAQIRDSFSGMVTGRTNENCRKYSEACLQLCQDELKVKAIDLWNALQKRDDWLSACFTDGIHFTAQGSKIVVKEVLKILGQAEWQPNLHWKSLPIEFSEYDDPQGINLPDWDNVYDLDDSHNNTTAAATATATVS